MVTLIGGGPVSLDVLSLSPSERKAVPMTQFLNEPWFWSGLFVLVGSLGTLLIQECLKPRNQARIERLKIYDSEILAAHKSLYRFASTMGMQFAPPGDTRRDFVALMKDDFYKSVKPNMLLFSPEIRRILTDFEAQYHCLGDPDLIPKVPFDDFIDHHLHEELEKLEKHVERTVDSALVQLR